jgi:phage terminase large subunit-like protein
LTISQTTNSTLQSLQCDPSLLLKALEADALLRQKRNRLSSYVPYPKQAEFHAAGLTQRERLLMAGNQVGKTLGAGFETAMHLTGLYPDWWIGRRFNKPTIGWASGVTGESTRDNPQRILLGRPLEAGTGTIPKSVLLEARAAAHGVADAVDHIKVRHVSGEVSLVYFKSYEKGREKWQGETLDFVWFDEEPPADIYSEGLTRTQATGGCAYITFTPLLGMSEVVRKFLIEKSPGTHVTFMTIDDAAHYTPEQRAAIIAGYPAHEREARARGVPTMGSGRVFPVSEESITEPGVLIPPHWPRIVGIDFGWDHPTAAAWIAWDRDADTVHIYDTYRVKEATPVIHAAAIKARGEWPVAWPHDGLQHDKGSGLQLAVQYRNLGVAMLADKAEFADGTNGVEAGVLAMLDRMQTGRLKVAGHLTDWFEEFRLYHRKDGKLVKEGDDLISATRYALMCLRFARIQNRKKTDVRENRPGGPHSWMG